MHQSQSFMTFWRSCIFNSFALKIKSITRELEELRPFGNLRSPLSYSMEMCDQRHNITMCPLCDKTCSYWKMSSACATARASHLFDNPATVFFSVFMALWGKWSLQLGPPTLQGQEPDGPQVCVLGVKAGHVVYPMATGLHCIQDEQGSSNPVERCLYSPGSQVV